MAEFCVISGQTVRFQTFTEEPTEYAGEEAQSFLNTPLSSRSHGKRRWSGNTIPYTPSEFELVRALAGNGYVNLACSGPAFDGDTPTCRIEIGPAPYVRDRMAADKFKKEFSIRFREV